MLTEKNYVIAYSQRVIFLFAKRKRNRTETIFASIITFRKEAKNKRVDKYQLIVDLRIKGIMQICIVEYVQSRYIRSKTKDV